MFTFLFLYLLKEQNYIHIIVSKSGEEITLYSDRASLAEYVQNELIANWSTVYQFEMDKVKTRAN